MLNRMYQFLRGHYRVGNGSFNLVGMAEQPGCFNVGRKDQELFWKIYCESVEQGMHFGLAEMPDRVCPLINDTDIKIPYKPEKHQDLSKLYDDEYHLKPVVKFYQQHLKQLIENYEPKHGICFVLEKEKPTIYHDKNVISHGFHLHFPNAFLLRSDIDIQFLSKIQNDVNDCELFSDLGIEHSSKCIDSISNKPWLLYGSKKKDSLYYYQVTKIYNDKMQEVSLEEILDKFVLYDVDGNKIQLTEQNINFYLPRILSLSSENKETLRVKKNIEVAYKKKLPSINTIQKSIDSIPVQELLHRAQTVLPLISSNRSDNYQDWITIGWILYNISCGSYDGFELWNKFSAKTSKPNCYSEAGCLMEWQQMKSRQDGVGIGTLFHFAKLDNPDKYNELQLIRCNQLIESAYIHKGQHSLAKWMFEQYKDEFICASIEKDIWYEYKDHRWHNTSKGIELKKKISTDLFIRVRQERRKLLEKRKEIVNRHHDEEMESDHPKSNEKRFKKDNPTKQISEEIDSIERLLNKLEENTFKNGIMKECSELFYQSDFLQKLDQNVELMHFSNGILDLKELTFREGRQKDYVSMTTGYEYKEFNSDDLEVLEAMDHFEKVFPDDELREYFLEYSSSLLKGGNFNKTFVVMTGSGDNGKSVNIDILYKVLGEYAHPLPTALIFGKRTQSSGPTPDLASIVGVRFSALQESNKKDEINIGVLKELTGNDMLYARGLNRDPIFFKPQLKISLICNKLPKIDADDQATWNRIRILPYDSKFPKEDWKVPDDPIEQKRLKIFPRDPFMDQKIDALKQAFAWIFFQKYIHVQKFGKMEEPASVMKETIRYRIRNDMYRVFMIERMIFVDESDQSNKKLTTFVEIYKVFQDWYMESYPGNTIPNKNDVFEGLKKKLCGKNDKNKEINMSTASWSTYRLRTSTEITLINDESYLEYDDSTYNSRSSSSSSSSSRSCSTLNTPYRFQLNDVEMVNDNQHEREEKKSDEDDEDGLF